MPSASHSDVRQSALYAPLRRRMVENGDWDRMAARLARELNESGWIDRFKDRSKEMARGGGLSVESILAELVPLASEEVPITVRNEVLGALRKLLERQIDFT
ncbi:uncharacterized protein BXZ73DRAFT_99342 [Epithele typhae]|uniref:uncharacterized protein n=1 Tax=Epithele typhae TaxID=378194 RepID=UPI002008D6AA|nr:uncharacterized protein BXZ73DRAFT_99342 [Epithele typhae]KAH9939707.1 hypothetical protein BXZ73DRAFT_99342 [Epithele typhae]